MGIVPRAQKHLALSRTGVGFKVRHQCGQGFVFQSKVETSVRQVMQDFQEDFLAAYERLQALFEG